MTPLTTNIANGVRLSVLNNLIFAELEKFVSSGKRIEIPQSVHPKIRELISSCWSHDPLRRPDMNFIVNKLTEVMESLPGGENVSPVINTPPPAAAPQYSSPLM